MGGDTGGGALRVLLGRVRETRWPSAGREDRDRADGVDRRIGRMGGRRGGWIDRSDPPSVLSCRVCHSRL